MLHQLIYYIGDIYIKVSDTVEKKDVVFSRNVVLFCMSACATF